MSDQYEDEEYYGEEEDYADEAEHEEYDEDDGDVAQPAKPKTNIVRTALFGVAGVLAMGGIAYFAASMFAPDTLNDIVNNLPFVSHEDQAAKPDAGASTAAAPHPRPRNNAKGDAGASGADVAAVPPDPAKASAMKPKPGNTAGEEGAPPATEGMPPAGKPGKPPHAPKPGAKPVTTAAQPNAAPMEGMPPAGTGATKPGAKPNAKPQAKASTEPAAKPLAKPAAPQGATAAKPGAKPVPKAQMADARAKWLAAHPRRPSAQVASVSRGAFLGYGSHVVWVHGRARRVWTPLYAVVHHRSGVLPLARHTSIAALPASWKQAPHGYVVQVGSFANATNASQLVSQLRTQGIQAYAAPRAGKSRVFIGGYANRQAAAAKMQQLQAQGVPAAVTTN